MALEKSEGFRFCSLGSGSKGNATLVGYRNTLLMIDCGFSLRETLKRLKAKHTEPQQITAILVTHEHSDHISGVAALANKFDIPVWLNKGTAYHPKANAINNTYYFNNYDVFELDDIGVIPVAVPHDSREATQFVFKLGNKKLGILTDVGHITPHIIQEYEQCNALLLEFNYASQLLLAGKYPRSLKQRVMGSFGHLSNDQAVDFLNNIKDEFCEFLAVMHKSEENNSELEIQKSIESLDSYKFNRVVIANQKQGFDWATVVS